MSKYPFKWNPISDDVKKQRQKIYTSPSTLDGLVSDPLEIYIPRSMEKVAEKVYNFEVRPDDIWIVTYPKCGTTWTQELVWQIVNNVDIDTAKKLPLFARTPFLESEGLKEMKGVPKEALDKNLMLKTMSNSIETAQNMKSPRVIKSHLPFEMLPPNLLDTCKVIFVSRNPKDTCVSYFHHAKNIEESMENGEFIGTFADFAETFLDGNCAYGSYWTMLKSAWQRKSHPNLKIMWFEDMKKDLISVIRDVSQFIGYHMTELKILQLDDLLYIDNLRKITTEGMGGDPKIKKHFRKGIVGDWKNYFNKENNAVWDKWIAENLEGTDIKLPE